MRFCIYLLQWYSILNCSHFCYFGLLEHRFFNKLNLWHTDLEYGLYTVGQSSQYPNALCLMRLETHQFDKTRPSHSCSSSAGIHPSQPKARAWLNPWGNSWHEALVGNLWCRLGLPKGGSSACFAVQAAPRAEWFKVMPQHRKVQARQTPTQPN